MAAAEAKVERARSGDKVTVASKLPMALILQLYRMEERQKTDRGTTWIEKEAVHDGPPFAIIAGTAYPNGPAPDGMELPEKPAMVAGYALTPNVSREKWERWLEANKSTMMVVNRLVFAYPTIDAVRSECRANRDVQSGLQPYNPQGDVRLPKKVAGNNTRKFGPLGEDALEVVE